MTVYRSVPSQPVPPPRRGFLGWVASVAGFLSFQTAFPTGVEAAGPGAGGEGGGGAGSGDVNPFRRLRIDVPAQVRYEASASTRVRIDAPARVREGIAVRSANGSLIIEASGSWSSDRPVRIAIQGPADLAAASLAGSTDIVFVGLKGRQFELTAEGSSQVVIEAANWQSLAVKIGDSARARASGQADRLRVQVQDSGDWDGAGFPAETVEVRTEDSARARIQGRQRIEAFAAGASTVVTGGPARVERHVEDAATISGRG